MCGIVGMISIDQFYVKKDLLTMLKRLEYRGYDSVGFALSNGTLKRGVGQISQFMEKTGESTSNMGIAHTRWATHGGVLEKNAHPHYNETKTLFAVHNGIIENSDEIRERLNKKGHIFTSDTDSEIIIHYMEEQLNKGISMNQAIVNFQKEIKGTFAILLFKKDGKEIYAIKRDSPLVLGILEKSLVLSSDIYAFSDKSNKAIFFENDEFAMITKKGYAFYDKKGKKITKKLVPFNWEERKETQKKFAHYMIKEIYEQPIVSARLLSSLKTTQKEKVKKIATMLKKAERVIFIACGTSYHAGLIGESILNSIGRESFTINATDHKPHLITKKSVVIAITQSGETMDVIIPLKDVKKKGIPIIALVNVPHSTIQRMSDSSLEISAGQEICVASTKAFTNQVITIMHLAQALGYKADIEKMPEQIEAVIEENETPVKKMAKENYQKPDIYIMGKGPLYATAREIALKIKEISYMHAEGMQAGELKHGTIALIEQGVPTITVVHNNDPHLMANTKEVEARGAVTTIIGNEVPTIKTDYFFRVPNGNEFELGIYSVIVGQMMAYYIALNRKLPIDKPRNLAKSVTVV